MNCRHCGTSLKHTLLDLGASPPSNAYLSVDELNQPELYYPLRVKVCTCCWLVQTEDFTKAENLFSESYAYFSSTSSSWLKHAAQYTHDMLTKLSLDTSSLVIEIACNDGYLLKNFIPASIPCLGIEPTHSTASAAEQLGIPVIRKFFTEELGQELASQGKRADLVIGNNVYAHVPDINNFTKGLKAILKPQGTITLEFPHVLELLDKNQFDTIYHEHFSYFSLYTVHRIFKKFSLRIWHVEQLSTHGGSLRVFACHANDPRKNNQSVTDILVKETNWGLHDINMYKNFQLRANQVKNDLLLFLIKQKKNKKKIIGYGAAAKGNTLLNYSGIKSDLLPFVSDAAPSKQGKFLPGSRIPILAPSTLIEYNPDYVLILPWNLASEIQEQFIELSEQGTQFITVVPRLNII
jgi:SAM-dependent methyltransferase